MPELYCIRARDCDWCRVTVKFVIGSEPCLIPLDDRLSQYACDEWQVTVPGRSSYDICAVLQHTASARFYLISPNPISPNPISRIP